MKTKNGSSLSTNPNSFRKLWTKTRSLALCLILLIACQPPAPVEPTIEATVTPPPTGVPTPQPASGQLRFIYGDVAVAMREPDEKTREIALPHASVFLVSFDDQTNLVASTLSDLSGRFSLKTKESGPFTLCVEAEGFLRFCSQEGFTLDQTSTDYGVFHLPIDRNSASITAYGEVTLRDGSRPRGFEPFLGVNAYAQVQLNTAAGTVYEGHVNNFGEYIIPSIPIDDEFNLSVVIDNETLALDIATETELQGNRDYRFDLVLRNAAPRIRLMSASENGTPIQAAVPGSNVTVTAVAEDPDGDALEYRWLLPDGQIEGPSNAPELAWTVPAREGRYTITVLVSDNRGGYLRDAISITATSGGVPFSGTVVDSSGAAISGAQIDVNGRLIHTNNQGWFSFEVPVDEKYVFTIRKPGVDAPNQAAYGTVSFVYTGPIAGGRWVLNRAQVSTVDPTQPIVLDHRREEKDCRGPQSSKIDWTPYLQPGLFDWQDGRGNSLSLGELGQTDAEAVQGVMHLLSRIDFDLTRKLAEVTQIEAAINDNRVQCLGGIRVEIPANALENPTTHQAPSGNVQVALSTVDLSAGDQMPGDYTAIDSSGQFVSMESFGAGGVEIGAGNERFNLKPGMTATVTIPVDATQLAGNALLSPTIPFLYYDEQNGVWRQEGDAVLTGTGVNAAYVMTVKHFSTMNADVLKSGQSCVAVEVDPLANFTLPLNVEVIMQPSVVSPDVIQVRTLTVDTLKSNVIFNLPNDRNIVLAPIIQGVKADGSTGDVPAGVFVVNTGGPMNSTVNPPAPNPDGSYYAEVNGQPTGPCGSRVTLKKLNGPTLAPGFEFLQGFYFQASNITDIATTSQTVADNINQGAKDYYQQADPRGLRASFTLFKQKNRFGQPLNANEVEWDAQYANSGDLGFGRDMHCRRNVASDGEFDVACYVTNYGQPPIFDPDQVDADNAHAGQNPNATVAMEWSRVENPPGDPNEFLNDDRAVKFYVYDTNNPNSLPITKADLDGFGERPVPQLCVICHGGQVTGIAADPGNPTGPTKGAFTNRDDIINMKSNFLPFDLHLFNYPASKSKASQQAAFKSLNIDIVKEVASANGSNGTAIVEMINTLYAGGSATQLEDEVILNWDGADSTSDSHRFYRDVFARACRTCHVAEPFAAPVFTDKVDFQNAIGSVQSRVCLQKVMPHAKRTNDIFWTSFGPNMPGFLQLYGENFSSWASLDAAQCGLFFQGGNNVPSTFATQIYPILVTNCSACHSQVGIANFSIGNIANTYTSLLNATATDGTSKYIVPNNPGASLLYQRITQSNPGRMPLGGPDLQNTDTDSPPDGTNDALEILNWINSGAPGP